MTQAEARPRFSKKLLFNLLLYVSLAALGYALYRADYLRAPRIVAPAAVVASAALLLLGFLANALAWRRCMALFGYPIRYRVALAGMGLSVFAKYLPGKIWVLLGRAAYSAEHAGWPLDKVTAVSVRAQAATLWTAMTVGAVALIGVSGQARVMWLAAVLWLGLTVVLFSAMAHRWLERLASRLLRRPIAFPWLAPRATLRLAPWFAVTWLLWAAGFYCWCVGLSDTVISARIGLAFPLTVALGMMAVIAPGGLGVREGLIALFLRLEGFSLAEAATLSVSSRLWFLFGEIAFFLMGWAAHRLRASKPEDAAAATPRAEP